MSHALHLSEPEGLAHGGAVAARALSAVADDAGEVAAQLGFVGTQADWADMQAMTHATNDPTRARLRWLLSFNEDL